MSNNKPVNVKPGLKGFQPVSHTIPKPPTPVDPASHMVPWHEEIPRSNAPIIKVKLSLSTQRPFPQANSLSKVASVVDAVAGGADTDEALAMAIDVVNRQGAYYAHATAYLGFITETGASPRGWMLTAQGIDFLRKTPADRVSMLTELVGKIDVAVATLDDSGDAESEIAINESLSSSTASRRAATIASWINIITSNKAIEEVALEYDGVKQRLPEAAKFALEAKNKIRQAGNDSRPVVVCPNCFTTKSANGVCLCD